MTRNIFVCKTKRFWLISLLIIVINFILPSLFAYQVQCRSYVCHPVLALGGGFLSSSKVGESQTFPITNVITDMYYKYTPNNATSTVGLFDAFLGMEWGQAQTGGSAMQLGIGYNQAASFTAKGTYGLVQGADATSEDTFPYSYDVTLRQLLFEGKLLFSIAQVYHPYLFGGIGVSFNTASGFTAEIPPFLTFTRVYENNTNTELSYSIGAGLDYDLDQYLRLGIGYRFSDYGKVSLGNAKIDVTPVPGTLSQSHMYTNELLAQVTCALN